MAACQISGHPDSYGLGIRLAFYLQWFGMILASCILPSAALNLQFLNSLTIAAAAIGLAINIGVLQPAEILVVLLLVCGALYFFVPVYSWKMCTLCRQWWDPELWTRVRLGSLFKGTLFFLYGALLCLQLWFWSTGVHHRPSDASTDDTSSSSSSCKQYGFIFAQVQIDNAVLITFNIVLHFVMLLVGTWVFACWVGLFDGCHWYRRRKKERWRTTPRRIRTLQEFRILSDIVVASVVTTAVELVISWNNINDVNNLDTAAQLIPLAISAAYVLRSIYLWLSGRPPGMRSYTSGSNTVITSGSHWGRLQRRRHRDRVSYFHPEGDWTRRRRRHSNHSRYYYHHGHRSRRASVAAIYDERYMPEMSAAPSAPHATYNQAYRSPAVDDAPATEQA